MRGNGWRRIAWAIAAWTLIAMSVRAIRTPWTWTLDQRLFLFLAVLVVIATTIVTATWGYIWSTHGTDAMKARWNLLRQAAAKPQSTRSTAITYAFWIALTVSLVIYINLARQ